MGRPAYLALSLLPLFAAALAPVREEGDPVARLKVEMASGGTKLAFEPRHGYLVALLKKLDIDPSSQTLVFSKTSLQSSHISPKTPRAIYFNRDTYVGWIPGAPLIEIMSVHPTRGVLFYTLRNEKPEAGPLQPDDKQCARCHGGIAPRLFASSVSTAPSGYPRVFAPSYRATPDLPLAKRWGGWYVTGEHGPQRHMGNELSLGTDEKHRIDVERGANVKSLSRYIDLRPYLTPHSDIVALMFLEAQMEVQNALSQTHASLRYVEPAEACEPLVEALLCSGEARLSSPVAGTAGFRQAAPTDRLGRSLSDLDLKTRLLKYPCSPLVYSPSFDALPVAARTRVWSRLREILGGQGAESGFAHLSALDRRAVLEILRDTKPEFARFLAALD